MRTSNTAAMLALAMIGLATAGIDPTSERSPLSLPAPERAPEEVARRLTKAEKKREKKNRARLRREGRLTP